MLLGASQVAAGYIPDLILMNAAETASAADKGLLETLDPLLSTPAAEYVFPNLLAAGTNSGMRYGLPFALDFLHLAYRTSITISFPLNWTSVMESGGLYLFASGGSENYSSDSILIQYLGVDGILTDPEGRATLESRLLTRVLDSYKQVSDSGTLAAESLRLSSPEGVWNLYRLGEADFAEVWASQFRAEAQSMPDTAYARIPTRNGRTATLAHVWMWSMPARALELQQAAISFLEWIMSPSRQRAWCEPSRLLPAGPQAWPLSGISSDHNLFLMRLAEEASPFPVALRSAAVSAALQEALAQGISGGIPSRQAAEQAIAKMKFQ
jgi:ABC-type glycerol-3-phosphate transport system substrate-binding protein